MVSKTSLNCVKSTIIIESLLSIEKRHAVRCSAGFTLKEKRGNKTDGIDREYLVR